jgi:hypothetical protein
MYVEALLCFEDIIVIRQIKSINKILLLRKFYKFISCGFRVFFVFSPAFPDTCDIVGSGFCSVVS